MTTSPLQIDSREQAIAWLYGRVDYERMSPSLKASDFKLDRMRNLLDRLDNPQDRVPVVHIAGTKGKGSTAAIISAILREAGYSVGMFTSPHIDRFEERIQISGQQINEMALTTLVSRLAIVAQDIDATGDGLSPTFFELTTALGWLWFAESSVDIAVVEVGLGGRLDSTNICRPELSVITTISRDHTHILGTRLADIAREKAGIIKAGIPTVCGVTQPEACAVISEIAEDLSAPLEIVVPFENSTQRDAGNHRYAPTMHGWSRHQKHNATVAIAAVKQLQDRGWKLPQEAIDQGLLTPAMPLRIERLSENPIVLVDAAHNWLSAGALIETVRNLPVTGKRVLIFGTSQDKDVSGLCRRLFPWFDSIVLSRYDSNLRAMPLNGLLDVATASTDRPLHAVENPADAWEAAQRLCPENGLICIAGSFFLAAEIRRLIVPKHG